MSPKMSVGEMENGNVILKDKIKELESALISPPLFSNPIDTIWPWKSLDGTPESNSRLRGTMRLLIAIKNILEKILIK